MEVLSLGLLFSLAWNSGALPLPAQMAPGHSSPRPAGGSWGLAIHPQDPLVEVGGSIQLHCSLDCPGGKVQWEGLDTELGNVISGPTSSILIVTNATVRMEGLKFCTGQCGRKSFQKTVELQVYSFPDTLQLDSQPKVPTAGQPAHLFCLASHVYPPDDFTLSWFQGDEGVEPTRDVEDDMEDSDLFMFRSEWEIPAAVEQTTYRCEATLQIGRRLFRQSRTVTVEAQEMRERAAATTEAPSVRMVPMTDLWGPPERPVPTTDGTSSLEAISGSLPPLRSTGRPAVLMPAAATALESPASPTVGRRPSTGSPSTAHVPTGEALTVSSEPTGLASTSGRPSQWTWAPTPETFATVGVASTAPLATEQQPAPELVSTTGGLPPESTAAAKVLNHTEGGDPAQEGLCRPVITSFPPQGTVGGTLRITCHALRCHQDIRVQWVETPVAQSQYHHEKAEGQSNLTVHSVSSEHQGIYRCITVTSQPRVASVRVVVATTAPAFDTSTVISIGATSSVFGLLVASYVSRRVWQRRSS